MYDHPPRPGNPLELNNREIDFSFFPTARRQRQWRVSDTIFAVSPRAVMQGAIDSARLTVTAKAEARAFLHQGQDFYVAAREKVSANPLLYYYSFLNIGKALLRVRGLKDSLDYAHHGLRELGPHEGGGQTLGAAALAVRNGKDKVYVFPALLNALGYSPPANKAHVSINELLAQIVVGHRQWRDAADSDERFVRVEAEFRHDNERRQVCVCLYVATGDLSRFGITPDRLLGDGWLDPTFRLVRSRRSEAHCFELRNPEKYDREPAQVLRKLADVVRPSLWAIVSALPGTAYRRYYLHLTPPQGGRLPQLGSLWATLFYLGSVMRYRPHLFDQFTAGPFGPFITEFISAQPAQMVYMLHPSYVSAESDNRPSHRYRPRVSCPPTSVRQPVGLTLHERDRPAENSDSGEVREL